MRFTPAVVAAFAIASIGTQAAPTPDGATSSSVAPHKPTEKVEHKPEHKPVVKEPEYELICKDVAFFHDWDIHWADVSVIDSLLRVALTDPFIALIFSCLPVPSKERTSTSVRRIL